MIAIRGPLSSLSCMGMSLSSFELNIPLVVRMPKRFLALKDWKSVLLLDSLANVTIKNTVVEVPNDC